jgi:hypothetical protein
MALDAAADHLLTAALGSVLPSTAAAATATAVDLVHVGVAAAAAAVVQIAASLYACAGVAAALC